MPESLQIVLGLGFLAVVYILTRIGVAWRLRRSSEQLIHQLRVQGAMDVSSAVDLGVSQRAFFKLGLRDYRAMALQSMVRGGVVGQTVNGKYYLTVDPMAGKEVMKSGSGV